MNISCLPLISGYLPPLISLYSSQFVSSMLFLFRVVANGVLTSYLLGRDDTLGWMMLVTILVGVVDSLCVLIFDFASLFLSDCYHSASDA